MLTDREIAGILEMKEKYKNTTVPKDDLDRQLANDGCCDICCGCCQIVEICEPLMNCLECIG